MVLEALGADWKLVGLGWYPWDIESTHLTPKVRIQVKQCAALQLWKPTQKLTLSFPWTKSLSKYYVDTIAGIEIEGYMCDVFVVGLHLETDVNLGDQMDVRQWEFLVIPVSDLIEMGCPQSMVLSKAQAKWEKVRIGELGDSINSLVYTHP